VVRVEVDTWGVVTAAGHLRARAGDLRGVAPPTRCWPAEVQDPGLRSGVAALASAVADLVEVLALDQELLADKARAGARLYADVEQGLAAASVSATAVMSPPRPSRPIAP
jgi:hypothetical protein